MLYLKQFRGNSADLGFILKYLCTVWDDKITIVSFNVLIEGIHNRNENKSSSASVSLNVKHLSYSVPILLPYLFLCI